MKYKKLPKQKMSRQKFKLLLGKGGELDEIMEKSMLEKYNNTWHAASLPEIPKTPPKNIIIEKPPVQNQQKIYVQNRVANN